LLEAVNADTKPNELITALGDDLLARFTPMPLLDAYDVYEQLMDYWHATIHDDAFLIMNDGWKAAAKPRKTIEDKDRKLSEEPDLVIGSGRSALKYKTDLIPPSLIVARYFADDQAMVDDLNAVAEDATRAVEEYTEEHAVEDGLLAAAIEDDKISRALTTARLKTAKQEKDAEPDELKALEHLVHLYDAEGAAKKAVKEAQAALDLATLKKYGDLTDADVKTLVLDDKWHAMVTGRIANEVNALTLALVGRIRELGERYAETAGALTAELATADAKVARHLAAMGIEP
jgi:type I restriction enzyme M protein